MFGGLENGNYRIRLKVLPRYEGEDYLEAKIGNYRVEIVAAERKRRCYVCKSESHLANECPRKTNMIPTRESKNKAETSAPKYDTMRVEDSLSTGADMAHQPERREEINRIKEKEMDGRIQSVDGALASLPDTIKGASPAIYKKSDHELEYL